MSKNPGGAPLAAVPAVVVIAAFVVQSSRFHSRSNFTWSSSQTSTTRFSAR